MVCLVTTPRASLIEFDHCNLRGHQVGRVSGRSNWRSTPNPVSLPHQNPLPQLWGRVHGGGVPGDPRGLPGKLRAMRDHRGGAAGIREDDFPIAHQVQLKTSMRFQTKSSFEIEGSLNCMVKLVV